MVIAYSSNSGNVTIVPGVVVNKHSSVAHASDLVSVVPPRENLSILGSVHLQPVVSFSEIINDDSRSIVSSAS